MYSENISLQHNKLAWWSWVVPFVVLHLGSEISALFKYAPGAAVFYLPTAIGIILVNWLGPKRVIPSMYVNSIVSAHLWGVGPAILWPLYAIPGTLFIFLSWFLFSFLRSGRYWLPDFKAVVEFLILGLIIPLLIEIGLLELIYIQTGTHPASDFFITFTHLSLRELITNFGLTVPVLYYFTYRLQKHGLLLYPIEGLRPPPRLKKKHFPVLIAVYLTLFVMAVFVPFEQYWYLFGIFSFAMAMRYGFGVTVVTNTYIFLTTFLAPLVSILFVGEKLSADENFINIYLGTSLLYIFSSITARVISDLVVTKKSLIQRVIDLDATNQEMEIINQEMDRFVYSVSHDLSAPLKSIRGLANISQLTDKLIDHRYYFQKIEASVRKMEGFINEILDYSRNKRQDVVLERIDLHELCAGLVDELKNIKENENVHVELDGLTGHFVVTDLGRLKVILSNLTDNAFKYQNRDGRKKQHIKIFAEQTETTFQIHVADNGEGIADEIQPLVFKMFFRGHEKSQGSGLGLYIVQETAARINAVVSLRSIYGEGSTFTVSLKK